MRHSTIQGRGLFATRPLAAGITTARLGGRQPIHYRNHSCDPTLWHADAYTLVTRRAVDAGEELTVDYAT